MNPNFHSVDLATTAQGAVCEGTLATCEEEYYVDFKWNSDHGCGLAESTRQPYRILVADEHPVVREGLVALINRRSDMMVIAEASSGRTRSINSLRDLLTWLSWSWNCP